MSATRDARAERAAARATWPVECFQLGAEPEENLRETTTPEQRLGMMWELAVQAWTLSGQPMPSYDRRDAPGLVRRATDRAKDLADIELIRAKP